MKLLLLRYLQNIFLTVKLLLLRYLQNTFCYFNLTTYSIYVHIAD